MKEIKMQENKISTNVNTENATRAIVIENALQFNESALRLFLHKLILLAKIKKELARYQRTSQLNQDLLSIFLAVRNLDLLEDYEGYVDEDDDDDDDAVEGSDQ